MRILVTGGAGFIASHIVDAYIEAGHEVIIIDNLSTGQRKNINKNTRFYQLDVRSTELRWIFDREKPDVVNHHAAQMDVRKSVEDPVFDANINIIGMLNLFELAVEFDVKKLVFSSTGGAVYGEQEQFPAPETHPCRPLSPYGISKFATEKYLEYYRQIHALPYVALRYANVYGPRQNPEGEAGVVAIFCRRFLQNEPAIINGDGKQTRDFVFVQDVVQANLKALDYNQSDIFNIGTGMETDVNTLFRELRQIAGSSQPEQYAPAKSGEQLRSVIDSSKAKEILGWEPQVTLAEGLRQTYEFFKEGRDR